MYKIKRCYGEINIESRDSRGGRGSVDYVIDGDGVEGRARETRETV